MPRGGPWPLEPIRQDRESDASQAENKRNIAYHYDVSNAFYQLWLDKEMVYTCAYFHDWGDDLDTVQLQKLDMVCRKLRLKPGETMLDMGCGWGALVLLRGAALRRQQLRRDAERTAGRLWRRRRCGGLACKTR